MKPEIKKLLYDVKVAGDVINRKLAEKSFDEYRSDPDLQAIVERKFEVIGEAVSQAVKIQPELIERIGDAKRIIAFRNLLIHAYSNIDQRVVWRIAQDDLPVLTREVEALLKEP